MSLSSAQCTDAMTSEEQVLDDDRKYLQLFNSETLMPLRGGMLFHFYRTERRGTRHQCFIRFSGGRIKELLPLLTLLRCLTLPLLEIIIRHTLDNTLHSPRVRRRLQFRDSRIPREVSLLSGHVPD